MKALVISPQPFFSPRGTPLSVYYRTLVAAELGVEIDLLTYGQGDDVAIPGVRIIRIPAFRYLGPVKVGPSHLKLWLDAVLFLRMVGLMWKHRYDVVHAHEEAIFLAAPMKPIFGFKLIYDMHSSLPAQLRSFEFVRSKTIIRLFEWLENVALRSADAVIAICEDLHHHATTQLSDEKHKVFLIENSVFEAVALVSNGRPSPAKGLNLPTSARLVVYAGTMEPYQGIDLALRAFRIVAEHERDVRFLLAGGNPVQVRHFQALARELGIAERCVFTGTVPRAQAQQYLRIAAVLVSPRRGGTNTPLKIYEQLASGKPLVATRIHAHTQVLTDDVAYLVAPDPEGMARGLLEALHDTEDVQSRAARAAELYRTRYSRGIYERKMQQVLEAVQ